MGDFWALLGPAVAAAAVMSPVHCLFGLHIVRRGVIFIDLAVAQIAGLGMAFAVRAGHEPGTAQVYWSALAFALIGALLISLTRFKLGRVPHEAIIGIFFVASSAATLMVLQGTPHGAEELQRLLAGGDIMLVSMDPSDPYKEVKSIGAIYLAVLVVLAALWRSIARISLKDANAPTGALGVVLDFAFYSLLAFIVASSVQVAGVLVVFTWLVMPAVIGFLWFSRMSAAIAVSIPVAVALSIGGMWFSFQYEMPTGAAIVATFSAAVAVAYLIHLFLPSPPQPDAAE
jgi:zinc/manganese transport system permease protein